ncbi:MAG: type II toxin-antitoxin system HipA family toxin [Methylococcaceae bacterium]|nr:type II toxin-antitoxin system HipA family toxin [Methylococcaceae bacterium]
MKKLLVYYASTLVGYLSESDNQELCFSYTNDWLINDAAIALSPDIYLSDQLFSGDVVESFFGNLLPEGDVLDFISQAIHISSSNVFGLLERFGGDTAGAFSILPEGLEPSDTPHYLPVSKNKIKEWFQQTKGLPLNINGEQSRMSLSGAQDKMTVFIDANNTISIPLGAAPSTHIIKPSINHRLDVPHTAINEVLIMTLAKKIKLLVAETRYDPELCAAIITRYDREIVQGKLRRLHQIDLCQTLGLPSNKKYEAEGGPSLVDCIDAVLKQSSQPAKDKKRLIEWVVFNILVGNMDSHAKNLSVMTVANKKELTPFYDLVCTAVYPNLSQKFAFKIGSENRPDWIMRRHWERFANDIATKPQFVINIITDMIHRIDKSLPIVVSQLKVMSSADEILMIEKIDKIINTAISKMQSRISR